MLTKILDGVVYVNVPEIVPEFCTGCVGDKSQTMCEALITETSCIELGIWIKENEDEL